MNVLVLNIDGMRMYKGMRLVVMHDFSLNGKNNKDIRSIKSQGGFLKILVFE